ncbi:hypothetical protein [Dickeya dadantii]|uniref:hypothetical protein n=1 Tax=Dickeya dadantii TaxID=204038 RepID=UPI0011159577|nr:hypothetical protein [Dickeya dadantii]
MKQIYPDLWQTRVEHPFSGVNSHAYLLVQDTGNILFYNSGSRERVSTHPRTGRDNLSVFEPPG